MRPESLLSTWLRKWREAKSRPVQGNSPNDRFRRGTGVSSSSQESLRRFLPRHSTASRNTEASRMRFLGIAESIGPMGAFNTLKKLGAGVPPPVGRPRGPAKGRDGRSAPCSSSAMSSDRLFLDRVARQHCPSPLHRHAHTTTPPRPARSKPDISTLQGIGHFYFALTLLPFVSLMNHPSWSAIATHPDQSTWLIVIHAG